MSPFSSKCDVRHITRLRCLVIYAQWKRMERIKMSCFIVSENEVKLVAIYAATDHLGRALHDAPRPDRHLHKRS